jgi:hypothetical protein
VFLCFLLNTIKKGDIMGRPVNKRIFQTPADSTQVQLKVTAKLPGVAVGEGSVVSQKGTRKYKVNINGTVGDVFLVEKTLASELLDGECILLVSDADGNKYPVTKITQHKLVVNTPSGLLTPKWAPTPDNPSGIGEVSDSGEVIIDPPLYDPETNPVVSYRSTISEEFRKPGTSTLIAGSGIPATDFAVVRTNYIELGLTAYRRGSYTGRTITDNNYHISLDTLARDWNWTYSVGTWHPASNNITQMYDVTMYFHTSGDGSKNRATALTLPLQWNPVSEIYFWDTVNGYDAAFLPIADNGMNPTKSCAQNSTRPLWFNDLLPSVAPDAVRVEGMFTIELEAISKDTGLVSHIEITVNADPV